MPLQAEEGLRLAEMQFRRKRRLAVQPIQRILQNGLEHLEIGHGQPQAKAVHAVFFIDPKGVIRAMIYYPLSMGRNFDELYRALIAMQAADAFSIATPADWQPGDDVIVPTAGSCGVAKDRMDGKEQDVTCHDWFFCTKPISKEKVLSTILKK